MITLRTPQLSLGIDPQGAEPRSLTDAHGRELLWQAGDPWNRSACLLFPAICRHTDDLLRGEATDGQDRPAPAWPMPKHGLARDLDFTLLEQEESRAVFTLVSTPQTREAFPWDFELRAEYSLEEATAILQLTVTNRTTADHGAGTTMPYALGWHPAFAWQLPTGEDAGSTNENAESADQAQAVQTTDTPAHVVEFEAPTPPRFHRLADDLLLPAQHDTAQELGAVGSLLPLRREHFADSAVLFPDVADTAIVYRRLDGEGPRVRLSWEGFDTLTLWSAPGGDFVCLEPWAGRPQEAGSTTPDTQRADLQQLKAGASRTHTCRVTIAPGR